MTHFRLRWQKLGGHVHVNVWSGTERLTTHGRNGELVFREEEWEAFKHLIRAENVEIVPQSQPLDGVCNCMWDCRHEWCDCPIHASQRKARNATAT